MTALWNWKDESQLAIKAANALPSRNPKEKELESSSAHTQAHTHTHTHTHPHTRTHEPGPMGPTCTPYNRHLSLIHSERAAVVSWIFDCSDFCDRILSLLSSLSLLSFSLSSLSLSSSSLLSLSLSLLSLSLSLLSQSSSVQHTCGYVSHLSLLSLYPSLEHTLFLL